MMIAQRESMAEETERQKKERAVKKAQLLEARRNKVYDDIVFDSSAMAEIHPRFHKVEVHHLHDLGELNRDDVTIDAEYFPSNQTAEEGAPDSSDSSDASYDSNG